MKQKHYNELSSKQATNIINVLLLNRDTFEVTSKNNLYQIEVK